MPNLNQLATSFSDAIKSAFADVMEDTRKEALRLSSGGLTYAQLRAADHPYAVRHGEALVDPSVINRHNGGFYNRWQSPTVASSGDELTGMLVNDSNVADFLQYGTSKMVPRPIKERLEQYAKQSTESRVTDAVARIAGDIYN